VISSPRTRIRELTGPLRGGVIVPPTLHRDVRVRHLDHRGRPTGPVNATGPSSVTRAGLNRAVARTTGAGTGRCGRGRTAQSSRVRASLSRWARDHRPAPAAGGG